MASKSFRDALLRLTPEFGLELDAAVVERFARHFDLLVTWNRKVNLTRIVDPTEAARLHFLESAYLTRLVEPPARLIDVGSGAGFPGVPLACLWPECEVTLVEPATKRAVFLKEVVRALGLERVRVRSERFERAMAGPQTLLVARAVDQFRVLLPEIMAVDAPVVALYSEPDLLSEAASLAPGRAAAQFAIPGANRRFIGVFRA